MMPSAWRLRRVFGPLVRLIARGCIRIGLTPNTISAIAFFVAVLATCLLIVYQLFILYGLLVFVAGLLDGVDGEVARRTQRVSLTGGFIDSLLDRLADIAVLLPFLWIPSPLPQLGASWGWVIAAVTGSVLVSYVRSRAQASGVFDLDVGLAARSERLFILVVTSLLIIVHPALPYLGVILVAVLSHLTVLYRVLHYRRQLQELEVPKP